MKKYKYFIAICLIILIAVLLLPKEKEGEPLKYTIVETDSSNTMLLVRIIIDHRTSEDTLALISEEIQIKRNWQEKLVCFFYIKVLSHDFAWASYSYLPKCTDCSTDAQGNHIQYQLIGMRPTFADSLSKLTLDTIQNKKILASYLEDTWNCKTQLYTLDNVKDSILMTQLFSNNEYILTKLRKVIINGEVRYYSLDPNNKYHIIINNQNSTIEYYNSENTLSKVLAMLD